MAVEKGDTGSKMSIIRIVQVLLRESDKDHPLSQQEILDYMEGKYGMAVNRKSVGRNLTRLRDAGLPVFCREVPRMMNGKKVPLSLDWYWDHVLAREDLKALIDLLYFSHLPPQQVKQLAEKLKRIQIRSFDDGKTLVRNLPSAGKAADFDPVIALLTTAGEGKRKISFYYDHYEADGKRHHGRLPSGEDRLLSVSPLLIIASDDRYALLAEKDEGGIEVYFLDLMSDVKLLEDPASDTLTQAQIQALKPSDYLYSAHEIFRGKPELCTFEADWHLMTDIVNDFGKTAHLSSGSQTKVTIEIMIQPEAMKAWAMRHAPLVKILSPAYLVKEGREAAAELARLYGLP